MTEMSCTSGEDFVQLCAERRSQLKKAQAPLPMANSPDKELPDGWLWASVSSLCERVSVGHVGPTSEFFSDDEAAVPLVRSQDVRPGKLQLAGCAKITPEFHGSLKKSQLKSGDVLIVRVGANRGDCCVVPVSVGALNCANIVFARPFFPNGYLSYYLRSPHGQSSLLALTTGAAQGVLNTQSIAALPVPVPPFDTQRRIASILSAYDDLIENNTRRIAILEEMARRIYEEWFVHFRFPGHEQVKMVESDLGLIPEGWRPSQVGECVTVQRGKSYKSTELGDEGGLPFVNLKCMERDGGFRKSGLKRFTGSYKKTQKVSNGDLVMAVTDMTQERRIVARCGRVPRLGSDFGVISMDLVKIDADKGVPREFMYGMFRWSGFADEVKQHANGANVLHLSPDRIAEHRFALPSSDITAQFTGFISPILHQCDVLLEKNEVLRATRDLLLPKLISGELDVSSVQNPAESLAA